MSAVMEAAPPTRQRLSPVDCIDEMTPDEKEDLLVLLLKELIRENSDLGWIPITTATEHLGSFLPAKGERELFEQRGPKLSTTDRADLQRVLDNPGPTLTFEEMLQALREDDPVGGSPPE